VFSKRSLSALRESFAVLSLCNSEIGAPIILFTPYTIGIPILKLVHREIHHIAGEKFNFGIGAPRDTSHSREFFNFGVF
jgi:hypothetical protein